MTIPVGYCQCGCGGKTKIAAETIRTRGHIKGEPLRFIHTHHARVPLRDRFWQKVDIGAPTDCWPWRGASRRGYGTIMVGGYANPTGTRPRPLLAHRVAWELTHGPIRGGLSILHRCDNPICVNPAHLFVGTQSDNMRDAAAKDRLRGHFGPNGDRVLTPRVTHRPGDKARRSV